jgi:hypothetical protein
VLSTEPCNNAAFAIKTCRNMPGFPGPMTGPTRSRGSSKPVSEEAGVVHERSGFELNDPRLEGEGLRGGRLEDDYPLPHRQPGQRASWEARPFPFASWSLRDHFGDLSFALSRGVSTIPERDTNLPSANVSVVLNALASIQLRPKASPGKK